MSDLEHEIAQRLDTHGVKVSAAQVSQFAAYMSLLRHWNAKMNLTTLESGDAAIDRLIVEPALAAAAVDLSAAHLLDVGSGGGSPAIPLKIMRPDLRLTMVEVRTRKSVFLREVARHLNLGATSVETATFQAVLTSGRIEQVDAVSVRAVRIDTVQLGVLATALTDSGQLLWFLSEAQGAPELPISLYVESSRPLLPQARSALLVLRRKPEQ